MIYIRIIIIIVNTSNNRFGLNKMAREADRKKFIELAEKRVTRTIKDIKLIGNLSNKSNYSYTKSDTDKIYRALKKAIDEMKIRFESSGASAEDIFKL